jgi:hypothetical protein
MQDISWLKGGVLWRCQLLVERFGGYSVTERDPTSRIPCGIEAIIDGEVVQSQILLLPRHGLRVKALQCITIRQIHPHGPPPLAGPGKLSIGAKAPAQLQELCACVSHVIQQDLHINGPLHACAGSEISKFQTRMFWLSDLSTYIIAFFRLLHGAAATVPRGFMIRILGSSRLQALKPTPL